MQKKSLTLFLIYVFIAWGNNSLAQAMDSVKVLLIPSMVVNESGFGDATLLVDEQALAGDPLNGNGGSPGTVWSPGWQADRHPAKAYIDLGQLYNLSQIFIYDLNGIGDFLVEIGEPDNWDSLFTDDLHRYQTWKQHPVNIQTRYIRFTRQDGNSNAAEVVLYGAPVNSNNPPVLQSIGDQTLMEGDSLRIILSATDLEYDSLIFSLDTEADFISLTDSVNGWAQLDIVPGFGQLGTFEVTVTVTDEKEVQGSETFLLSVTNKVVSTDSLLQVIGIDFSHISNNTPPEWNRVSEFGVESTVNNLKNKDQQNTGYALKVTDGFNGYGLSGLTTGDNSGPVPDAVMSTFWFNQHDQGVLKFNLDKTKKYKFRFYGGRDGNNDDKSSDYSIGETTVSLYNFFNVENEVFIEDIFPNENGEVFVTVKASPGYSYAILNGITIEEYHINYNHFPIFTAIEDQTLYEGDTLMLNLSASDADGDSLQFSLDTTAAFVDLTAPDDSTATLSIMPGPETAGEYPINVKVSDGHGGEGIGTFTLSVLARDELIAPENFTFNSWDETSITLSWQDKSTNEEHYILERSDVAATDYSTIATLPANANHYTDQNLEPDHIYYYRLKAIGQDEQQSPYAEEIRVKTARAVATNTDLVHAPRYGGNISAVKWKNYGSENERLYTYHYDAANRITAAQYAEGHTSNDTWTTTSLQGGYSLHNLTYDHNGNITTLNRQSATETVATIDALSYAYQGNKLLSVLDQAGSQGLADRNMEGDDYEYDANGNMVKDLNQGIGLITYNHLNLPEQVNFEDGSYVIYVYDATGTKLAEALYDAEDKLVNEKHYMGAFLYENDTLRFIHHEEGRVIANPIAGTYEYQYHLRDHLGNVRLTFTASPEVQESMTTLESAEADEGRAEFLFYDNVTKINAALFDHTEGPETHYSMRLNGTEEEKIGLAKSLAVMPGDVVSAEVYAKYIDPAKQANWTQALHDLIAAIASGTAPVGTVIEGVPDAGGEGFDPSVFLAGAKAGETGTMAYLNYLVFDKDFELIEEQSGYVRLTGGEEDGSDVAHQKLETGEIVIKEKGYVYIYLSNDNPEPMEVFFDDFKVVHVQSEAVQADDYYPFGLTFNHYRDTKGQENKYLYQGKELLAGTGLYDFHARGYNAALGRFMQVDPQYNGPSGYIGMLNNPLGNVDPDGEEPLSITTALIIGVAVSAVSYTAAIAFSDGGFDNWDWGDFGKSVTIGAVSSVITFGVGEIFQGWVTVNSAQEALKVVAKAATHATVQGTIGTIDGGDFGSSFLSGFAGSMMGTAGDALKWGSVGTVSSAMLMGGVSSELSGGEFWRGAAIGGIVAGANHVAHRVGASAEERVREKRQQPKLMDVTERFNNQLNATRAFFSDVNEMFNKMYPDPIAREAAKIAFFTEMVKTNAPFDIKVKGKGFSPGEIGGQQALYNGRVYNFDDFGNYNFGVAAQALGLSENFAVFGAGFYQTFFQPTNDWSNWRGFFDHAQDTKMIRTGYNHFK